MPLLFSELELTSKEIEINYNGKTFHVTYNPSAYNGEFVEKADNLNYWEMLSELIIDWDLMGDEQEGNAKKESRQYKLPIKPTLKKMSQTTVIAIWTAIRNDVHSPNLTLTPPTRTEGSFSSS